MKINGINNTFRFGFTSLRTDKKEIEILKNGQKPILDNKKENILIALNNLAQNSDRSSIEFLLDVAQHLTYGQSGDSEFKDIIDDTTSIEDERENTDWSQILAQTIQQALDLSGDDVSDLKDDFEKIFSSKHPLTPEQQEVLDLRTALRQSVQSEDALDDAESLTRQAQIINNIDYFVSSSEIPLSQKKECLEKFIYFLSDDYKITPQLADKKLNVVDEMLNDMLIKTPDNDLLTIKTVNQLYTGMCAAISICRKAIAYEDKVRYMEIIMEELKDSPTMEVFDITDLSSGAKVNIPKINIDYDTAIEQGYRIIDASAHNWMHNAHASGDGTIQTESYVAFDNDSFGIYDDTSWYEGLNPELSGEKVLLRALIKEKEALDSVQKLKKKTKNANAEVLSAKKKTIELQSMLNGKLSEIFTSVFPELSSSELSDIQRSVISFYKGTRPDNEMNIASQMPKEQKQQILVNYIKSNFPVSEDKESVLQSSAKNLLGLVEEYVSADEKIKKLTVYNTKKGQYTYYKKLFNLAAAHRLAVEADVNLDDGVVRFERISGLPPRDKQVIAHLKGLLSSFDSETVRKRFAAEDGTVKTKEELEEDLLSDILTIETVIPRQLDAVSKQLFGVDIKTYTKNIYADMSQKIKDGDSDIQQKAAMSFGIKNDKVKVYKYIDKWVERLDNNPSDEEVQDAIRLLGYENRNQMIKVFAAAFIKQLQEGISEEQFEVLKERFGGEENFVSGIEEQRQNLINALSTYDAILEKWNVPSARDTIIKKMEKSNSVLSRRKLEMLQRKFMQIRHETSKNDSIANVKERKKANSALYDFSNNELDVLNAIEKAIPEMKKYCKMEYQTMNQILFDDLEKQYSNIGMLNGQFWVREEGSTGLAANEQVRIIEQMTGKPYHIQSDIEKAAAQIKKGDGSGIISYSVDDSSYAFHAQYAPSITNEVGVNPDTGNKEGQDILWTDNSWGRTENDYFWTGRNGLRYTDYGQGFGWKNGFLLSNDTKIGLPVQTIKSAMGVDSEDKNPFGLFVDMVLPGMPVDAYQKLYKMFSYILSVKQNGEYLSALETMLKNGYKLDIRFLDGLDDIAEKRSEILEKRIEKEFKSKEDYDKLPDDDYLKLVMEMLSLYLATPNPQLADSVLEARSLDDVKKMREELLQGHIEEIGAIVAKSDACVENISLLTAKEILAVFKEIEDKYGIKIGETKQADIVESLFFDEEAVKDNDGSLKGLENYLNNQVVKIALANFDDEKAVRFFIEKVQAIINKAIDENIKIKSLDSPVLTNSPLHDEFISAVDKYLKPSSDEELLILIQGLQNADYETADGFFDSLQPEDVGLDFKEPFEYIQKLQMDDSLVKKAFGEVVATNVISTALRPEKNSIDLNENREEELATPEDLYRILYVRLSEMDVQKYIRKFKAEAFAKYKVRQAFPQPVVLPDDAIVKTANEMFNYLEEQVYGIIGNEFVADVFEKYENIIDTFKNSELFNSLLKETDFVVSGDEDKQELEQLINQLTEMHKLTSRDNSLSEITDPLGALINYLASNKKSKIEGKKAGKSLNEVVNIFDSWQKSSIDRDKFIMAKQNQLAEIKHNTKVLINANIDPAYRNEAAQKVHNIISLLRKNASSEELDFAKDDFTAFLLERHIINNPTVLLKECISMLQSGKSDSDEYSILRNYLNESLKVAQQTKTQYKLVQNAHDGISSKTKDLLPLFSVTLSNGQSESMNSEIGMLYLIEQLKNQSDDNVTLQLFLNQSGLSKLALSAVLNNFEIDKSREIVDEKYQKIISDIEDLNKLNSIIIDFLDKSRIPFKSITSAVDHLKSYVQRKFKNSDDFVVKTFIDYLSSIQMTDELKHVSKTMIIPLLKSISEDAVSAITVQVNNNIDYIADIADLLTERAELVSIIDVPKDSEEYKRRENFYDNYDKTQNYIKSLLSSITSKIEKLDFLTAQYKV